MVDKLERAIETLNQEISRDHTSIVEALKSTGIGALSSLQLLSINRDTNALGRTACTHARLGLPASERMASAMDQLTTLSHRYQTQDEHTGRYISLCGPHISVVFLPSMAYFSCE